MNNYIKKSIITVLCFALSFSVVRIASCNVYTNTGIVWDRLDDNYALKDFSYHPQVKRWIKEYTKDPKSLQRLLERSRPFMYLIVNEIENRGLPGELAFIPLIESAFEPGARSHAGAVGMWQLISATGKRYGLHQDRYYDGRLDIQASTEAALNYLTFLSTKFDKDWLLVMAAYNCGEGRIDKAIARNKKSGHKQDFWSLRLPDETKQYVPKILAIKAILNNPGRYGLTLPVIYHIPHFTHVDIGSQKSLAQAASLAGISLDELKKYNRAYPTLVTHPNGPSHIMLPIAHAKQLQKNIRNMDPYRGQIPPNNGILYIVKSGETLNKIAQKSGVSKDAIKSANNLRSDALQVGQKIVIPSATVKA